MTKTKLTRALAVVPILGCGLVYSVQRIGTAQFSASAQAPPGSLSGFKITFGLRQGTDGRSWAGAVRHLSQVRSVQGWHISKDDSVTPPGKWDIKLAKVVGDVAPKAVLLDVASAPDREVTIDTANGEFSFKPDEVPYGKVLFVEKFQGDVSIERVPVPQLISTKEFENDDPSILKTRQGGYWMAWVGYKMRARKGYFYTAADEVIVSRSPDGRVWSPPASITPPGDHFRVALGEDARGRIWCIYALQKRLESGNFDLYARVFDGKGWSQEQQLTTSPMPDVFHRMATDRNGNLFLVWMGYRSAPGGGRLQSDILMRVCTDGKWSEEINVSQSAEDDWEPSVAVDSSGRAWVAWDSYRKGANAAASYDVLLRSYSAGRLEAVREVSATPLAEMRADVAVDSAGRVWIAWEEGGTNWAKDTGLKANPKSRINLRPGGKYIYGPQEITQPPRDAFYRSPRVAVLDAGQLKQTDADLRQAYSESLRSYLYQSPRLGVDGSGRIWLFLRHQLIARGRSGGQFFDFYATTLVRTPEGGQKWMRPALLPASTGRQDTVLAAAPGAGGEMVVAIVGDGRRFPVPLPIHHDISTLVLSAGNLERPTPRLAAFHTSNGDDSVVTHPEEPAQVAQVRGHRLSVGGTAYKIVRGDTHRHTEISMDGGVDGTIWDLYRYAMDAADFDYVGVTDHNYGAWLDTDEPEGKNTDDEYQWWRTQKSADIFYVPGRFVPLYGYERSINFPLGHRNIFHIRRGVFSYRVPKLNISQRPELIDGDAKGFWAYLRTTNGIGIAHTSGTSMGTDWVRRDDQLEPLTEIYQGCRNSYEEEGAPRAAALPSAPGDGGGGLQPFQKGLIWNALGVGYKMGFVASSDHYSTHISYANLLVPDRITTREDIQEAFRKRRSYASTDNIVLDFYAGKTMQGGELAASSSPTFEVDVLGTEAILKIEVVKNNRVIYTWSSERGMPGRRQVRFSFRDTSEYGGNFADTSMGVTSQIKNWSKPETNIRPRPAAKESYYYVRVIQSYGAGKPDLEGETAWSSPIFVRQQ